MPTSKRVDPKLWYIYTMEFYAAERKKELIPFATAWMVLESIMLSEISQMDRDKYHTISPLTGTQSTKEKASAGLKKTAPNYKENQQYGKTYLPMIPHTRA